MLDRTKVFLRLWVACILGSIAVMPYLLSVIDQKGLFAPLSVVAVLKILQDAALYGFFAWAGLWFARQVDFHFPFFSGEFDSEHWSCLVWRSIVSGVCVGMTILSLDLLFSRIGPAVNETSYLELFRGLMASLYGAINEEVLMRLFFVSFFVWILTKIFGAEKRDTWVSVGIVGAALLFGIFHLPAAAQLVPLSLGVVMRIVLLNGIGGIMFGLLFTRCGLEAAMIAHFTADLILHVFPAAAMMMFL